LNKTTPWLLLCTTLLTACGGGGGDDAVATVQNKFPTVSVNSATVFETEAVTLNATAADEDGSIAQYSWVQTGGTAVTFSGGTTANIVFTAPTVMADQILSFRVTVTDDKGASKTADGLVTVKFNQLPVVTAANAEVNEQTAGSVTAAISDADGSIASISWQQTAGPTVSLTGADTATLGFTTPNVQQDTALQFKVTATDNLGKSSSATTTVTVKTTDVSYSIKGTVTDAPIANAVVTAEVAGVTYTATANANGEYVLEIKLAPDAGDELIILMATAPNSAAVLFHSILGNAADIRAAAGNDTTLTNAELFATNVTNVTSAYYALLAQANNGAVPTTKAGLSQAALNVEAELLLPFATAVKLVLDYSAGNADLALPATFTTVAEWLANRDAVLKYINNAKVNAKSSYDEALVAIGADAKLLTTQIDKAELIGRYFVDRGLGGSGVAQFTLRDDYSGEWLEREIGGAFSWQQTAQGIVLTFDAQGVLVSNNSNVVTSTYLQSVTLKQIAKTAVSAQFSYQYTEVTYTQYGGILEPVETNISTGSIHAFKQAVLANAFDLIELNTSYALPFAGVKSAYSPEALLRTTSSISVAKLRLTGDKNSGTAYIESADYAAPNSLDLQRNGYPWQLNDAGQIVVTVSDTDYIEISALSARFSVDNPVVSVKSVLEGNYRAVTYAAAAKRNVTWNSNTIPGIYLLPTDPLQPLSLFWLELNADGSALTVSTYDGNEDGELSVYEKQQMPGFWQLDGNGDLHVRRYRSNVTNRYCSASQWQPAPAEECQLFNDRTMQLYNFSNTNAAAEQDVSIIIDHRFYDSYRRGGSTGNAQLGYDLLAYASYYNAIWQKVTARPIAID
jgi:hypothetical protein